MLPYYLPILLVTYLNFIGANFKKASHYFPLYLYLFLFFSLRYGIGQDYYAYLEIFENIQNFNYFDSIGFNFLVKIFAFLGIKTTFMIGLFNSFSTILFLRFVRKNCSNPTLGIIVYFCTPIFFLASISTISQSLAIGIYLQGINKNNPNLKQYILFTVVASLFHPSAIFLLANAILFLRDKFTRWAIIGSGLILSLYILRGVFKYIEDYQKFFYYEEYDYSINRLSFNLFIFILMSLSSYYAHNLSNQKFISASLFGMSMLILTSWLLSFPIEIVIRFGNYFTPFFLLIIDALVKKYFLRKILIVILLITLFTTTLGLKGTDAKLTPYKTWIGSQE